MSAWGLPQSAVFGGIEYPINADFRDVLEVIKYLNDTTKSVYTRWRIALALFYNGEIPDKYWEEAAQWLSDFVSYETPDDKPSPKLIDWEQDAVMIVSDVNKVAGKEIRAEKFLHWWTFLSYFYGIGEGQLSQVVNIRSKKAKGQKLDKSEQQYYRENRKKVDFHTPETPEQKETREYFEKWL